MCGLAGIVHFDGAPIPIEVLHRIGKVLEHRGPDADGILVDGQGTPAVGLAHRRLAIIDRSPGANQPLANEDRTVHAVLNGQIYNFRTLRRDLEASHAFRSQADTEVLVHGYEERGDAIVSELDGMFALAIWDGRRRRLVLARDPFGKKPLYYWHDGRRFVFGSEVKALLAAGVPAEMDADRLPEYLAFGYVPTPATLFRGIRKLRPASLLVVDAAGCHEPRPYWDLRFPRAGEERSVPPEEAVTTVRELLRGAIAKRLVADVPVGFLLSGGPDSGAVATLAARLASTRIRTFTIGFEDAAFHDERAPAARLAAAIGSEHHESIVTPDGGHLVETLLAHHDEPFGDSSALPMYLVAREARRNVTVVLTGDGGDETFAGYERFHAAMLADRLPAAVRRLLGVAGRVVPMGPTYHGTARRFRRFVDHASRPLDERMAAWAGMFDLDAMRTLFREPVVDHDRVLGSYRAALARCVDGSPLSRLLYLNATTYLLDDLLPKMDRMSMAHGLEARSPLLDRDLVQYVAGLPDGLKRRGARGKILLRRAIQGLVPDEILVRTKHGFAVPLGDWFRGPLRAMVHELLLDRPRLAGRLHVGAVGALFDAHLARRADWGHQLWTLLTLELWLRRHGLE